MMGTGITLLIDNYDSFTWNVYQYLSELGADVRVFRNDEITVEECLALKPRNVVISPGPGRPDAAGVSEDVITAFAGKVPILGVCLGEQCMYEVYGGVVTYAGEIVHGKTSALIHDGRGVYEGVPQGIRVTRYHSLAGDRKTLPAVLEITSETESNVVMGIRHKDYVLEGVQFHPESIASEHGRRMLWNFLRWEGGSWKDLRIRNDLVKPLESILGRYEVEKIGGKSISEGATFIVPSGDAATAGVGVVHSLTRHLATPTAAGGSEAQVSLAAVGSGLQPQTTNGNFSAPSSSSSSPAKSGAPSILLKIHDQRLKDVSQAKSLPGRGFDFLKRSIAAGLSPPLIDFPARLLSVAKPVAIMAEVKRASPSKGDIDINAHAASQALAYARGGAAVISVLTEPKWFKGSLEDMREVRAALDQIENRPAVLRKDFIVDEYQILEARLYGADTILLIVAILDDATLARLYKFARLLSMEPMVEVNNAEEMKRALAIGSKVIGVNNRNLHNFSVDMATTSSLARMVPEDVILVALSGISGRQDVIPYMEAGAKAVLVGESLMRSKNKGQFIQHLLGADASTPPPAPESTASSKTLVKICGVNSVEAALVAADSGADLIGLIFAPSARQVDTAKASEIATAVAKWRAERGLDNERQSRATSNGSAESYHEYLRSFSVDISRTVQSSRRPLLVGVFSNHSHDFINRAVVKVGLDLVQLHGSEPATLAGFLTVPAFKAEHVGPGESPESVSARLSGGSDGPLSGFVLDTLVGNTMSQQGGSGESFDWTVARSIADSGLPLVLAGGLNPKNVSEAIRVAKPWAVDVSSGVEVDGQKGVKDLDKIRAFVKAAKSL
ncbi:IGPS-domain-containing protein [Gonapodya prolifera JEL478]|uniref:Multifunctional tryptophan biosynthesis protein n=1 Tax=Gonapodya prolifera (strain JEL478) TaxID=1344416 RepID=A0A139ALC5_GONPJ|nr:IGPS-domain-containing protein [Gonapodya prolifera JEL478]|eukprot:KXS17589.1 IGPS-domain-containing protein [Gonapodya prolifera JEL478]